ncbi:MAG TPA: hypothetical protein VHX92_04405 [Rhizomicrobium sp.]|jgi:hypothetical protein|nr:hypothetical protein [Rhizomicrobium sp.]
MSVNSNTSLVLSVVREVFVLLLAMLFASTPFFAAQAANKPVIAFASVDTPPKTLS